MTTASDNVGIGYNALGGGSSTAITGSGNIAVGRDAGANMSSGNNNTAIGYQAGSAITTGTKNTLIGGGAGDAVSISFL